MIITRSVLLRKRNISDKICRENRSRVTPPPNGAAYKIMWKSEVQPVSIIQSMSFECWLSKATNTHSQYVIFTAFLLQQWLQEGLSILRYTYIACGVRFVFSRQDLFRDRILSHSSLIKCPQRNKNNFHIGPANQCLTNTN